MTSQSWARCSNTRATLTAVPKDDNTHSILVISHNSNKRAPAFRVLPQKVEANLFDAACVRNLVVDVWNGWRRWTRRSAAANWRVKLAAEYNTSHESTLHLAIAHYQNNVLVITTLLATLPQQACQFYNIKHNFLYNFCDTHVEKLSSYVRFCLSYLLLVVWF